MSSRPVCAVALAAEILVGAAILAKVERGEWPEARLLEMMGSTLTRPDDLALFGITKPNQSVK